MEEWSQFNRAWTTLLEILIVFSRFHGGPGISCTDSSLLPFPIRSPPAPTWRPAFPWCICAKNSVLSPISRQNILEISRGITKIYAMLYTRETPCGRFNSRNEKRRRKNSHTFFQSLLLLLFFFFSRITNANSLKRLNSC